MAAEVVRVVLNHIWTALEPLPYPCALIGGLALAAWNHPRSTRDVDLLIGADDKQFTPVLDELLRAGFRSKSRQPVVTVGTLRLAQLLYTPPDEFYDVQCDLILAESDFQKSAISRCVRRKVLGVDSPINILNCDDLVLFKLLAGRMIDRADAAMLLRENRDAIDMSYLQEWVAALNLADDFRAIWSEAFPGEETPD